MITCISKHGLSRHLPTLQRPGNVAAWCKKHALSGSSELVSSCSRDNAKERVAYAGYPVAILIFFGTAMLKKPITNELVDEV